MNKYSYEEKLLEKIDFNQKRPLAESVYLGLKGAILDGTFPLGERINENSLALQLAISRTPIRTALNRLMEEDLVGHVYEYGMFVKSINLDKIKEIYTIRKSLESLLYVAVVEKITTEELKFLKKTTIRMVELESVNQVDALNNELNKFNDKIHEIAQMATLTSLLVELNTYLKNFRNFSFNKKERRRLATKEHQLLVHLIEAKETEYLKFAVMLHISHAETAAIQFFSSKESQKNTFYHPKKTSYCTPKCPLLKKKVLLT